jgi:hypothetical protein
MDEAENEKFIDSYRDFKRREMRLDDLEGELERDLEMQLDDDIKGDLIEDLDQSSIEDQAEDFTEDFDDVLMDFLSEVEVEEVMINEEVSTIAADAAEDALV